MNVEPMKSRWLATSGCLSLLLAGMLFHEVFPRVWRLAFGEWHIPRALDDREDFHKLVRSKVHRAKLWLSGEHTCWRSAVIATCSVPAEHLLQELQMLDAKGGILRRIADDAMNPFRACNREYADMLTNTTRPLALIFLCNHFEHLGRESMALIMQAVLATCLCLAGDIWKELEMFYASWPYCLVYLAMSSSTAEAKLKLVRELFDASTCCLDEYFTEKVLALVSTPEGLLRHRRMLLALFIWSWTARVCNMATKRLIAQIRKSAPLRCFAARLLSSGFLTQIQRKHLASGGEDGRVMTRRRALKVGVPLRVAHRRVATPSKLSDFAFWANRQQVRGREEGRARGDRAAYLTRMRNLREAWSAMTAYAKADVRRRRLRRGLASSHVAPAAAGGKKKKSYSETVGNSLWGCSSQSAVLTEEAMLKIIEGVPRGSADKTRGLTEAMGPLRNEFLFEQFIRDEGLVTSAVYHSDFYALIRLHLITMLLPIQ